MREKLLEAAFRYKKAGLWKKLWDSDLFAVKLSCGELGYISIMGMAGEYCALSLYIGDAGFQSYRIIERQAEEAISALQYHELAMQQDCLQLALESKDDLMPEEVNEVRAYVKKNGKRLAGKNAYPHFLKYKPNYNPWKLQSKEDETALLEAINACVLLSEKINEEGRKALGFTECLYRKETVPLYETSCGELQSLGTVVLPEYKEPEYEYARASNDIMIASVKKLPHKGIWETELIRLPEPVQYAPDAVPYYPLFLLMVNSEEGTILPAPLVMGAKDTLSELLPEYVEAWKTQNAYPKEIRCRDARTYAFLKDLCEKTKVRISIYDGDMPALDEAEEAMLMHMTEPSEDEMMVQMYEMMENFLEMSPAELRSLPEQLLEQLESTADILPGEMGNELKRKLKRLKE